MTKEEVFPKPCAVGKLGSPRPQPAIVSIARAGIKKEPFCPDDIWKRIVKVDKTSLLA